MLRMIMIHLHCFIRTGRTISRMDDVCVIFANYKRTANDSNPEFAKKLGYINLSHKSVPRLVSGTQIKDIHDTLFRLSSQDYNELISQKNFHFRL